MELLARLPVGPEAVVRRPFLRVLEDLIGLTDLLEALFGIGLLADVGVILAGKLAVGALDLVLGGVAGDAHGLVVVFEFHATVTRMTGLGSLRRLWRDRARYPHDA
jgi:hypothetical protein